MYFSQENLPHSILSSNQQFHVITKSLSYTPSCEVCTGNKDLRTCDWKVENLL